MDPLQWMGAVRMRVQTADKKTSQQSTNYSHYSSLSISFMETLLWIMDRSENILMMDFFLTNKQTNKQKCFTSQEVNWWTGVMWWIISILYCDVFSSCLDFNSDGTHSLQRIHSSDVMLNFTKSVQLKKQTHRHLWNCLTPNALKFIHFKCDLCVVRPYSGFSFQT